MAVGFRFRLFPAEVDEDKGFAEGKDEVEVEEEVAEENGMEDDEDETDRLVEEEDDMAAAVEIRLFPNRCPPKPMLAPAVDPSVILE